jgi:probable LLM family oxidoreductase
MPALTLGIDTFGEVLAHTADHPLDHPETIRDLVEQGVLADRVGLDHFAIGEHHIAAMPISAPDVILAAIAARTQHIRLGSGVTVLSSDDPVRVYQRYATLDGISDGRAELILGRGSSVESFPLYGYDLRDYEVLFEEKLALLSQLRREEPVEWSGTTRPPLRGQSVYPHTRNGIPMWVGVGGSPESVVRAARSGMALMLAIIGGQPERFAPFARLFREATAEFGVERLPIGIHSPGHVAESDDLARAQFWPHYRDFLPEMRAARGIPQPTVASYEREIATGSLYIGSPQTVADKITRTVQLLGADRFDLKYGVVGMPVAEVHRSIELFGTEVAPRVRAATAD